MSETMTLERFEALVAAYGASTDSWPHEHRASMSHMLEESADAAAILARAARLDAVLDTRLPPPNGDLEARILRDMTAALDTNIIDLPQPKAAPARLIWPVSTALAACFVGGMIIGPIMVEAYIGGSDLTVALDIVSDVFLPTEPL